ncbi:MAG: hypothetical protein VX447_16370 [Pseudomonadota bacterium]|nr:hypothetical protein [Pseudomonadota bacterium]
MRGLIQILAMMWFERTAQVLLNGGSLLLLAVSFAIPPSTGFGIRMAAGCLLSINMTLRSVIVHRQIMSMHSLRLSPKAIPTAHLALFINVLLLSILISAIQDSLNWPLCFLFFSLEFILLQLFCHNRLGGMIVFTAPLILLSNVSLMPVLESFNGTPGIAATALVLWGLFFFIQRFVIPSPPSQYFFDKGWNNKAEPIRLIEDHFSKMIKEPALSLLAGCDASYVAFFMRGLLGLTLLLLATIVTSMHHGINWPLFAITSTLLSSWLAVSIGKVSTRLRYLWLRHPGTRLQQTNVMERLILRQTLSAGAIQLLAVLLLACFSTIAMALLLLSVILSAALTALMQYLATTRWAPDDTRFLPPLIYMPLMALAMLLRIEQVTLLPLALATVVIGALALALRQNWYRQALIKTSPAGRR